MSVQFDPILGAVRDGTVSLAEQISGFNSGTPAQQAAFQASVSGVSATLLAARGPQNSISVGGAGVRRIAGQTVYYQNTFAGYTWALKLELPVPDVCAVRFAVMSNPNADVTCYVTASAMESWGGGAHAGYAYQYAAFDLGDPQAFHPFVIPRKQYGAPREYWTDWITVNQLARTDGSPFAAVDIRFYTPDANLTTVSTGGSTAFANSLTAPDLKYHCTYQSGNFVTTNWGGFTATFNDANSPIIAVEYATSQSLPVFSVAHYTDSIGAAVGTTKKAYGPVVAACAAIHAEGVYRMSPAMCAYPGEAVETTFNRFLASVTTGKGLPHIAIFRPYSTNNGQNATRALARIMSFVLECRRYGIIPILETGLYEAATPARNAIMQTVNAVVRAVGTAQNIVVIEQEELFNAGNAATYLGDGLHPNDAGQALMIPGFVKAIKAAIVQSSIPGG